MKLDLTAMEKAVAQLEKSLWYLESDAAKNDRGLYEQFRAAAIQGFEYTYELCIKIIRRQLAGIVANPGELREIEFMDLIRTAYEAGIVSNPAAFKMYREMRNITNHTYDENKAEDVIKITGSFLEEVKSIIERIKKRNQ
jgi:nucleotidyltransferase substrate binding protein (TIGR01987 family)